MVVCKHSRNQHLWKRTWYDASWPPIIWIVWVEQHSNPLLQQILSLHPTSCKQAHLFQIEEIQIKNEPQKVCFHFCGGLLIVIFLNCRSYFAFRLASLHHQFFLRLRTEYTSLQGLSQQFGIPLKDIKNETNSLYKLEALTKPHHKESLNGTVNAETEFQIEFRTSAPKQRIANANNCKRSKSISNFEALEINEDFQNKENEIPVQKRRSGLVLDSSCLSGLPVLNPDKRRGVKMGMRAFSSMGQRVCRSMEAVNASGSEDLEQLSLHSVSLCCSSPSTPGEAYILGRYLVNANFIQNPLEALEVSI